jgi:hypothetical protein
MRPDPNGDVVQHFDNARLEQLISAYQVRKEPELLVEVLNSTQDRALTLIRFGRVEGYACEDELLSDIRWKLLHAVKYFGRHEGALSSSFRRCSPM